MTSYREHLFGLGLAPGTIRMYESMLKRARSWAEETGADLEAPTAEQLSDLRERFVESNTTLRQLRCALTHYWEMLEVRQPPIRALRIPPKPRYTWRGVEDEDAIKLAAEALRRRPEGLAVLIGLFTGFRRTEIAAMRWDRFSPDLSHYTVRGKGGYEDAQPIAPDLIPLLEEHRSAFVYLFPGEKSRHVNPATIWQWTKEIARDAGLGDFTTHQLRHTAIGWVYTHYGMRAAQRFARHARLDTTQIYTPAHEREVREATANFPWLRVQPDEVEAA